MTKTDEAILEARDSCLEFIEDAKWKCIAAIMVPGLIGIWLMLDVVTR